MENKESYEFNDHDIEEISEKYEDLVNSTIIENWVKMVSRLFRGFIENGFTREEAFEMMNKFRISGKEITE